MKRQKGFTLIELIVVIVILGILAATALPRFVNFQGEAAQAAAQGVAGAVTSASTINYSMYQVSTGAAVRLNGISACSNLVTSARTGLVGASMPAGYFISTNPTCAAVGAGETVTCVVSTTQGATTYNADATIICTG